MAVRLGSPSAGERGCRSMPEGTERRGTTGGAGLSIHLTTLGRCSTNFACVVFCELLLYGVLGNSREIGYSIDKGGPISSSPYELNALWSSSRSGLLPNVARLSKN